MTTLRQKRVAKLVIENLELEKPLTGGQILEKTGYAPGVIKNPSDILESKGVLHELSNYGFNTETAKGVVSEILVAGENDTVKLKAADMIFKVHGSYAAEKHVTLNIDAESTEHTRELGNRIIGLLRQGNRPSI